MNYTTVEQSKKLLESGLSPETADEHPRKGLWNSEKVMLFLIDAFTELPNGHGTFKLKKECSMEQLLEDLRKAMED